MPIVYSEDFEPHDKSIDKEELDFDDAAIDNLTLEYIKATRDARKGVSGSEDITAESMAETSKKLVPYTDISFYDALVTIAEVSIGIALVFITAKLIMRLEMTDKQLFRLKVSLSIVAPVLSAASAFLSLLFQSKSFLIFLLISLVSFAFVLVYWIAYWVIGKRFLVRALMMPFKYFKSSSLKIFSYKTLFWLFFVITIFMQYYAAEHSKKHKSEASILMQENKDLKASIENRKNASGGLVNKLRASENEIHRIKQNLIKCQETVNNFKESFKHLEDENKLLKLELKYKDKHIEKIKTNKQDEKSKADAIQSLKGKWRSIRRDSSMFAVRRLLGEPTIIETKEVSDIGLELNTTGEVWKYRYGSILSEGEISFGSRTNTPIEWREPNWSRLEIDSVN